MAETKRLDHRDFGPLYDKHARVLILGSFPSVKSREAKFYYGHPQNRFWRILRALDDPAIMEEAMAGRPVDIGDLTVEDKTALAKRLGFALWDTIESCLITGSSDASIRDVCVNDMSVILDAAPVRKIACNGAASYDLFVKHALPELKAYCETRQIPVPEIIKLPSSSPANAAWSLKRLVRAWQEALL